MTNKWELYGTSDRVQTDGRIRQKRTYVRYVNAADPEYDRDPLQQAWELIEQLFNGTPAQMSSPAGLLPINSAGMRVAIDRWAEYKRLYESVVRSSDSTVG